jgi:hypothetical protein
VVFGESGRAKNGDAWPDEVKFAEAVDQFAEDPDRRAELKDAALWPLEKARNLGGLAGLMRPADQLRFGRRPAAVRSVDGSILHDSLGIPAVVRCP